MLLPPVAAGVDCGGAGPRHRRSIWQLLLMSADALHTVDTVDKK